MLEATEGALDGRFLVQRGGIGYAGQVTVVLERTPARAYIEVTCTGCGYLGQGTQEDVGARGYDDWKAGVRLGVPYALRCAGLAGYGVRVTRIVGLSSDTNPTIVAAAAARAVWSAAGVTPDAAIRAGVEAQVLASFGRDPRAMPEFDD